MKNHAKRIATLMAAVFVSMLGATSVKAQVKVDDKEIIGTWIMTSMKYDGEDKEYINDSYNQVKVYRANGEYACAQVFKSKDGSYVVSPHEYGTYSLKNGMYSEMGRKAIKYVWIDKNTSKGRWMNRYDIWKKISMPEKLTQHILNKCKAAQAEPAEIQQLMKQYIFKK